MPWTLFYSSRAERSLAAIADDATHDAIRTEIEKYAHDERVDVRKLQGFTDRHRLRWGRWRVQIERDRRTHTMTVLAIDDRKEAYR